MAPDKIAAVFDPRRMPGGVADLPEGLHDLGRATYGRYLDMEAMLEATENPRHRCAGWQGWLDQGNGGGGRGWYGLPGSPAFKKVASIVRNGWQEGADRLGQNLDLMTSLPVPRSVRRMRVKADQGDTLDIHAVYAGRLERAWDRCQRREANGKLYVRIVVDSIEFGGGDSERMFWRGAACVALADILQQAGYHVELISAWKGPSYDGPTTLVCVTTVKGFGAPLDIPTAAAGMALPAFFRCIGHAWGNGNAQKASDYAHGFQVGRLTDEDFPGAIIAQQRDANDSEQARAWIEAQVERMNNGQLQMIAA